MSRSEGRAKRAARFIGLLSLRASGSISQFLANILLSRLLGPAGYGTYALFEAWHRLAGTLLAFGTPTLSLRDVARDAPRGLQRVPRHERLILTAAVVTVAVVSGSSGFLAATGRLPTESALMIGAVGLAAGLFAFRRLYAETVKGTGRAELGLFLDAVLVPLVIVVGALGVRGVAASWGSSFGILLHVAGLLAATGLGRNLIVRRRRSMPPARALPSAGPTLSWSLWGISLLGIAYSTVPFVLLPIWATEVEIGRFAVAFRVVAVAGAVLTGLASWFAPRFSSAHARGRGDELRGLLRQSQVVSFLAFAPLLAAFLLFPTLILSLFGSGFEPGAPLLRILAGAQAVNASTGLAGIFVSMVGGERDGVRISAAGLSAMIVLSIVLAPMLGVYGVAIGYVVGLTGRNVAMLIRARRRLRVVADG